MIEGALIGASVTLVVVAVGLIVTMIVPDKRPVESSR